MGTDKTRRELLRTLAMAGLAGSSGCATGSGDDGVGSVTPAPVPSDETAGTPTPPPTANPAASDIGFWVEVRDGFEPTTPARLEISLWNAGDRPFTVLDGPEHAVPFVDDDYAGVDESGRANLLLVPDDAKLRVDPAGESSGYVDEFLPDEPSDGCWRVPFDWPAARGVSTAILHAVPVDPGQIRRHGYRLYFIDDCSPGRYRFEHTFDLAYGERDAGGDRYRARLRFDAVVDEAMAIRVEVHDPELARLSREG